MPDGYAKLFLIQASACVAETITYPIDYLKTQMQVKSNRVGFFTLLNQIKSQGNYLEVYNGL